MTAASSYAPPTQRRTYDYSAARRAKKRDAGFWIFIQFKFRSRRGKVNFSIFVFL